MNDQLEVARSLLEREPASKQKEFLKDLLLENIYREAKTLGIDLLTHRPSLEEKFMHEAIVNARRSSCFSRRVGAVLVKDKRNIASGYNGAPPRIKSEFEEGSPTGLNPKRMYEDRLNEAYAREREEETRMFMALYNRLREDDRLTPEQLQEFLSFSPEGKEQIHRELARQKSFSEDISIHAEMSTILQVANTAENATGSDLYVTLHPCATCLKILHGVNVSNIYYLRDEVLVREDAMIREHSVKRFKEGGSTIQQFTFTPATLLQSQMYALKGLEDISDKQYAIPRGYYVPPNS